MAMVLWQHEVFGACKVPVLQRQHCAHCKKSNVGLSSHKQAPGNVGKMGGPLKGERTTAALCSSILCQQVSQTIGETTQEVAVQIHHRHRCLYILIFFSASPNFSLPGLKFRTSGMKVRKTNSEPQAALLSMKVYRLPKNINSILLYRNNGVEYNQQKQKQL